MVNDLLQEILVIPYRDTDIGQLWEHVELFILGNMCK